MPFYSTPKGNSPVLSGAGAPASGLGNVGDIYIDTTNKSLYGPKTSGGWGSGTSLQGPTGAAGPAGPAGTVSTHASSHASGGSDAVTLTVSQVTGLQTALDGKADSSDSRLSDARTPTSHAASHASGGSDPITVGTVSGRFVTTTTGGRLTATQYVTLSQILNGNGNPATSLDQMIADVASYGNPYTISGSGAMQPVAHVHDTADITSGTLADARLSANARGAVESFIHPFLLGGL